MTEDRGFIFLSKGITDTELWSEPAEIIKLFIYLVTNSDAETGKIQVTLSLLADNNAKRRGRVDIWHKEETKRYLLRLQELNLITLCCDANVTVVSIVDSYIYSGLDKPQCDAVVTVKSRKKKELIEVAPKLPMTKDAAKGLVAEFGKEACEYYKPVCSDYLLSNGRIIKDGAAFMRNWMRRERSEGKGWFFKLNGKARNGFKPHTAANTFELNMEFLKSENGNGQENFAEMFGDALIGEKESDNVGSSSGSLAPVTLRAIK